MAENQSNSRDTAVWEYSGLAENGLWVLHLFCHKSKTIRQWGLEAEKQSYVIDESAAYSKMQNIVSDAIEDFEKMGQGHEKPNQVICVAGLGHKADVAFMALSKSPQDLKIFQEKVLWAGLEISYSYLSITEISEYADELPEEMKKMRLYPELPPAEKPVWCFYPMSKSRGEVNNWFTLPFEERKELMHEHGSSGRKFSGRVLQVVTGSTGIDDYEWGVTLFCESPEALKEVVYTLRFDEASAKYGVFGPFYTGIVVEPTIALASFS